MLTLSALFFAPYGYQARTEALELTKELGKFKVVTAHTPKMMQGGYWSEQPREPYGSSVQRCKHPKRSKTK